MGLACSLKTREQSQFSLFKDFEVIPPSSLPELQLLHSLGTNLSRIGLIVFLVPLIVILTFQTVKLCTYCISKIRATHIRLALISQLSPIKYYCLPDGRPLSGWYKRP